LGLAYLVLGAAGMVGRKLTERLLRDGRLGKREITRMTLQDVVAPATPATPTFRSASSPLISPIPAPPRRWWRSGPM